MLRACGFVSRVSVRILTARAVKPVAACVGGYLNTLLPAPDSSSLRLPVLHLSGTQNYSDDSRKSRLQAKAAVVRVKHTAPSPAAAATAPEEKAEAGRSRTATAAAGPAATSPSTNAAVDQLGAIEAAPPLPRVVYRHLPRLMEAYKQGRLRLGAVPPDLVSSLLPTTTFNRSQHYVLGHHDLWFVPSKPLCLFDAQRSLELCRGDWMGLTPGDSWQGPTAVLVPLGPQQQQQQVPCAGLDMPGDWRVAASTTGAVKCYTKERTSKCIHLSSHLRIELRPLAADHSLLRAHVHQGTLHLYLAPSCFLQHPYDAPLLEQLLQSQLHDLAAGVPLAQWLAGAMLRGTRALSHPRAAWWCPFPLLDSRVLPNGRLGLPRWLWACPGLRSDAITLQLAGPTAAAAAALQSPPFPLPHGGQHVPHPQQQRTVDVDAAVTGFTHSTGVLWEVLHEEPNMRFRQRGTHFYLSSRPAWRRVLASFSGWYLFKAQAVPPGVIRLYLLPPWAFAQDGDSTSGDDSSMRDTDGAGNDG